MSSEKQNKRVIEGVVLGGLCSVIAFDVAEIAFYALDPVVKKCHKYFVPKNESDTTEPKAAIVRAIFPFT